MGSGGLEHRFSWVIGDCKGEAHPAGTLDHADTDRLTTEPEAKLTGVVRAKRMRDVCVSIVPFLCCVSKNEQVRDEGQ